MHKGNNRNGLIGLDLDGTVFNDDKVITEGTRSVIRKAIQAGYIVLPVTGRPLSGVPSEMLQIGPMEYVITSNGAAIYEAEDPEAGKWRRIYEDPLRDETVLEVLEILKEYPVVPDCFAEGLGHMPDFAKELLPQMNISKPLMTYILNSREYYSDLQEYVRQTTDRIEKVTINFYQTDQGMEDKKKALERLRLLDDVIVVSGAPHNLEVNHSTARKGNGLLKLAELLGIPANRIMACGDDINDLDMIVQAGFGVAMGNAREEVKKAADHVTKSNNDDGAAAAIEYFMERCQSL